MQAVLHANTTSPRVTRSAFVAIVFAGSFLLFLTQPMIARMALPRLGGAPAVWNSAMLVYQTLLLGGYAYAHRLAALPLRRQGLIHAGLFLLAACWLPIGLRTASPPDWLSPTLWVPYLLATSIGPLFFVVSAQAPLMQRWYAAASHDANPYPLYAASNLGSLLGLVSYPFVIEPTLTIGDQRRLWAMLYLALATAIVGVAVGLPRRYRAMVEVRPAGPAPDRRRWWRWALLAAVPSGLMLSTTVHLTTDIAAMPLLWILPLGLYLLSFSVAFADDRRLARGIARLAPAAIIASACAMSPSTTTFTVIAALLSLALLFVIAVAIHARMYDDRPDAAYLTRFYLASSTGGVLGGIFCALIAPIAFNWAWEHPLLILVAAALLAGQRPWPTLARIRWSPRFPPYAVTAGLLLAMVAAGLIGPDVPELAWAAAIGVIVIAIAAIGHRLLFAVLTGCLMLAFGGRLVFALAETGAYSRSYFGIYAVVRAPGRHGIMHGTTLHGVQLLGPGLERRPTTYYTHESGIGRALDAVPTLYGAQARIGVVGLGAGTLSCYRRPGQDWTFYEIDPEVARIARDPADFSFLARCAPDAPIVIGDARLTLARDTRRFDLLAIDAFSSDAVPMHLLTSEAFDIYGARVGREGLLLLHITNRWVDLTGVLGAVAARQGWTAVLLRNRPDAAGRARSEAPSIWIAMSRSPQRIKELETVTQAPWQPLSSDGRPAWTDDFASILPHLRVGGPGA